MHSQKKIGIVMFNGTKQFFYFNFNHRNGMKKAAQGGTAYI